MSKTNDYTLDINLSISKKIPMSIGSKKEHLVSKYQEGIVFNVSKGIEMFNFYTNSKNKELKMVWGNLDEYDKYLFIPFAQKFDLCIKDVSGLGQDLKFELSLNTMGKILREINRSSQKDIIDKSEEELLEMCQQNTLQRYI